MGSKKSKEKIGKKKIYSKIYAPLKDRDNVEYIRMRGLKVKKGKIYRIEVYEIDLGDD